jgi:hypothetical protein
MREREMSYTVYGALTGAGPGRGRAAAPARRHAAGPRASRPAHVASGGAGISLLAYWVTSDDSIMTFDNLIEADFISQSVYSYTCARPNTLPSSHMEMLNMLPY